MQSENISTPIYIECDKMYRSKVCVQEFTYFVSGLDVQLEKTEMIVLYAKKWLQMAKYYESCTVSFWQIIGTTGLAVEVSRSEFGNLDLTPEEC